MWNLVKRKIPDGLHFVFHENHNALSFRRALELLRDSQAFRTFVIATLNDVPYNAYRWETPGYNENTLGQDFAFVVLSAPYLDRIADSAPFASYIGDRTKPVVSFLSLGKDAYLLVPSPLNSGTNYCHLASFTQTAQVDQQQELWRTVGRLGIELASVAPLWLSTAGDGVAWLHIRFDRLPKYYHFADFKRLPTI